MAQNYVTTRQAAVLLGISQDAVRKWLEAGYLQGHPANRFDGWKLVDAQSVRDRLNFLVEKGLR